MPVNKHKTRPLHAAGIARIPVVLLLFFLFAISCNDEMSEQGLRSGGGIGTSGSNGSETQDPGGTSKLNSNLEIYCALAPDMRAGALADRTVVGCQLRDHLKMRYKGVVSSGLWQIHYNGGEIQSAQVTVQTTGAWHFVVGIDGSRIADISTMQALINVGDQTYAFGVPIDFQNSVSILTSSVADIHDFGATPLRSGDKLTVTLQATGPFSPTITPPTIGSGVFQYEGGVYPGTGGTCGTKLKGSCIIVFSYKPTRISWPLTSAMHESSSDDPDSYQFVLPYFNGAQDRELRFTLTGHGAYKADRVIGQANPTLNGENRGAGASNPSRDSLNNPRGIHYDGNNLFVADTLNNRVLIWPSFAPGNVIDGSTVILPQYLLGQTGFMTNSMSCTPSSARCLIQPTGVYSDGTRVYVSDTGNNRVLIWDSIPTSGGSSANVVLGQPDWDTFTMGSSTFKLNRPTGIVGFGGYIYVADSGNRRIMRWPTNAASGTAGEVVNADTLQGPTQLAIFRDKNNKDVLLGTDNVLSNNGLGALAWDTAGSLTTSAIYSFGYAPIINQHKGTGVLTAIAASATHGIFIADSANSGSFGAPRILNWFYKDTDKILPNMVIGQLDFNSGLTANPPDASSLSSVGGMTVVGNYLLVADSDNNRVLSIPLPEAYP